MRRWRLVATNPVSNTKGDPQHFASSIVASVPLCTYECLQPHRASFLLGLLQQGGNTCCNERQNRDPDQPIERTKGETWVTRPNSKPLRHEMTSQLGLGANWRTLRHGLPTPALTFGWLRFGQPVCCLAWTDHSHRTHHASTPVNQPRSTASSLPLTP